MIVHCPHCATSYVLPAQLVGPGGARVRCPRCQGVFSVGADGALLDPTPAPSRAEPEPAAPAAAVGAEVATSEPVGATESAVFGGGTAVGLEEFPEPVDAPEAIAPSPGEAAAHATLDEAEANGLAPPAEGIAAGRLFSEWGARLVELYADYRRRAGAAADPAEFRRVLLARWGIDLGTPDARPVPGDAASR